MVTRSGFTKNEHDKYITPKNKRNFKQEHMREAKKIARSRSENLLVVFILKHVGMFLVVLEMMGFSIE